MIKFARMTPLAGVKSVDFAGLVGRAAIVKGIRYPD